MSEYFAAFLRGVNVNGNRIRMDALQKTFEDLGFTGARTVMNTGNVVFAAEPPLQELKPLIETELKAVFGYDAPVYLRRASHLETLRDTACSIPVPEGCHLYLLLCDDASLPAELGALFAAAHREAERFYPAEGDAFWVVPKGETLASPFGAKVLGAKRYQNRLTTRNWHTVEKISAYIHN